MVLPPFPSSSSDALHGTTTLMRAPPGSTPYSPPLIVPLIPAIFPKTIRIEIITASADSP